VKKRLDIYHDQTEPLIEYYRDFSQSDAEEAPQYTKIEGVGSVDHIRQTILDTLKR
jgi:adenylate kinase